ncbi:MAG TPA: winged helix-turn-helix domain-containing protein [Acidimicrobiales bacterium]|nr:winged helix-turn-helix domain-containing protein [Acidimicrobiales bacterium]
MATADPEDLAGTLQRFGLARDRMRGALARRAGMSETDLDALEYLERDGPLTQRELGERLGITSGAVTMLVDRLEDAGWLRRRRHPTDRRSVVLALGDRAASEAPPGLVTFHRRIGAIVAEVPTAHRKAVGAFLEAAAAAAEAAAAELRR